MSKLRTPTGLRIGGTWLQPGDVVPDGVPEFDYAKAARKGLIEHEDGEAITNPADPATQATAEDAAHVSDLEQANHALKASLDQADAARESLQVELDQTRAALEELQNAAAPAGLPADAHARLVAIKGVGEKLADEILAALTRAD